MSPTDKPDGNIGEETLFSFDDASKETTTTQTGQPTDAIQTEVFSLSESLPTPTPIPQTPQLPVSQHSPQNVALPAEISLDVSRPPLDETSSTRSTSNIDASKELDASSEILGDADISRESLATTTVYLSLGSNLGDRLTNLREAVTRLERHPNFEIAAKSRVYETQSVEGGGDEPYLNAAVRGAWSGSAMSLLRCAQGVEERMGRPRPPRQGPRIIDIDILMFGESVIENAHLVVPHPRMMQRAFVLRPLCDVLENGWVREFARGNL